MTENQLQAILETLEQVKLRPNMFIAPGMPDAMNWLAGFNLACKILGAGTVETKILSEIMVDRGWETTPLATLAKMQTRLEPEAITVEFLSIQIEAWLRQYKEARLMSRKGEL